MNAKHTGKTRVNGATDWVRLGSLTDEETRRAVEWLREQKGYQTRVNAVLRSWMQASRDAGSATPDRPR